jgi:hypothetical protein
VFAEIAAKEFVSVQPMNLPSGLIFFLDFKYGTNQSAQQAGGSLFGGTGATKSTDAASGGLYGTGSHGYSLNDKVVDIADGENYTDVATDADADGQAAFTVVETVSGDTVALPADGIAVLAGKLHYHVAPTDISRGDFEAPADATEGAVTGSQDGGIPEVNLELKSEAIVAKTRKLKAVWTPELAQDLNAYHSVDAEAELTSLLSEYVAMEIDLEILDMLNMNANAKTERWSARVGHEFNSVTRLFNESSGASNAYTKGDWFQTLGNKIQSVSNAIHQKTLRGGANFIVVSPEVATILESIPGYATTSDGNATQTTYAMGVQKAGLLNNRYTVYKNPYQFENTILVGFRGSNFLETGAVYAPYVPLIMTPLVYDPKNFTPRKGVMTRYAKKMVRPEFYGKVIVADVNYV